MIMEPIVTLGLVLASLVTLVSPNIDSWRQHLDPGGLSTDHWGLSDHNLTQCLGACLCNGALADCGHRGLDTLPLVTEPSPVIHTL